MENTKKILKNNFHVRVYDDEVLKSIYELSETKMFGSMNELLNRALAGGVEELYKQFGKRKQLVDNVETPVNYSNDIFKSLKTTEMTIDDIFVLINILEMLVTSLYNVQRAQVAKEDISVELIDSGYFSELPSNLKEIKEDLIKRRMTKKR